MKKVMLFLTLTVFFPVLVFAAPVGEITGLKGTVQFR